MFCVRIPAESTEIIHKEHREKNSVISVKNAVPSVGGPQGGCQSANLRKRCVTLRLKTGRFCETLRLCGKKQAAKTDLYRIYILFILIR